MTTIDASALPTALARSNCSLAALVVCLIVLISSVSLLVGGATLLDPPSLSLDIPGVAMNRVAAAPVVSSQDAPRRTGDPRFFFTTIDSTAPVHGIGPAMVHDHLGVEPAARLSTSTDNRRQTNRAPADPATELTRGTRAESAQLATIEARRDDPRALLLRTAAWSRERGRTNG
jgi:hypothetical protein